MRGEQRREARRIAARHAAFGGDAVNPGVAPRRGQAVPIALGIIVMDKAQIELRFGMEA